jgi:site-specific recombinase XerD
MDACDKGHYHMQVGPDAVQQIANISSSRLLPALVEAAGEEARFRFAEFFAANIRNPHTRRAYARAVGKFLDWCLDQGVADIRQVRTLHVAAWIEIKSRDGSAPAVKQGLAAIRQLFDWLVVGQVVGANPAAAVRGPKHVVKEGKTPVLDLEDAKTLLGSINCTTLRGLRDRALIALMIYSFARIGAALRMTVEDVYVENRRYWLRLMEKGGKHHRMPCHHKLDEYLHAYLEASGLGTDRTAPLFPTMQRRGQKLIFTRTPLAQANAHAIIRKRAQEAGIRTRIGNHSLRATGITAYLRGGGTLEVAAAMANHASTRTTQLYDRRSDEVTLAQVELIRI